MQRFVKEANELLVGRAVAEVFPPMGDEDRQALSLDILKDQVAARSGGTEAGEQAPRMREQQSVSYAPMRHAPNFFPGVTGPPRARKPAEFIPPAGNDVKSFGDFVEIGA